MSGVTDCYQPIERKLELTRRCLEVLAEFRNPVAIITKNELVTRDVDLLAELAAHRRRWSRLSMTTLDAELAQRIEPRASHPRRRLEAIADLTAQGVPGRRAWWRRSSRPHRPRDPGDPRGRARGRARAPPAG